MITNLFIDGQKLDQYKDENVNVVSSVLSIKDLSKNTTDYSNGFTLPASPKNNQLFKHYYNANIDNTFDARKTTKGEIHIGGIVFKKGKWQLQKVNVKKGKPESYTVNFSGKLTSIKDQASDLKLKDLDFSAFDHDFNSANVKQGLTTFDLLGLAGDIVYTPLAKKQYFYNANGTDNTQTDERANIAFNSGLDAGIIWNDLKPSLKAIRVIEAIEAELGITFSRDFFATTEFSTLYLWLNPDDSNEAGNSQRVNFTSGDSTYMNLTTDVGTYTTTTYPPLVPATPFRFKLYLQVFPDVGYENIDYKIKCYKNGQLLLEQDALGDWDTGVENIILQNNDEGETNSIYWEVECDQEFTFDATFQQVVSSGIVSGATVSTFANKNSNTIDSKMIVSNNVPDIKVIDFLKGLLNMYKLVIVPTSDTEYYVNTVDGYYAEGNSYDITKYIDFENFDVERGEILNEINFSFQEPTTIGNIQYKTNNGIGYGDENLKLYTDSTETELLDGESLDIELPFEQILYDRLSDQNTGDLTNVQYGAIIDDSLKPANPKAHLHYIGQAGIQQFQLGFISDTGVKEELSQFLNTPFHGQWFIQSSASTTFDDVYSTWDGSILSNNLYTNHYKRYVEGIFDVKKRTFMFKAYLPLRLLTKIELNDVMFIKGNYYRIDNYSYNLLDGATDFELVNLVASDSVVKPLRTSTKNIYTDFRQRSYSEQLNSVSEALPTKTDLGFGTDWVSLDLSATVNNLLEIDFDENTSASDREMILEVTSGGQNLRIYLYQYRNTELIATVDSTIITVDNTNITVDNG